MTSRRSTRGTAAPPNASAHGSWQGPCTRQPVIALCFAFGSLAAVVPIARAQTPPAASGANSEKPAEPPKSESNSAPASTEDTAKSKSADSATTETKSESSGAESNPVAANEGEVIGKIPMAEPPAGEQKPATAAQQPTMAGQVPSKDELDEPGYLPGYRRYIGLGQSPYAPPVAALPGGFTPGYGAPMPTKAWTFTFAGSANISAQYSGMSRRDPAPDQSSFVLHAPPRTIEEWSSFTSSSTVPGNWVSLRFIYGTSKVSANVSVDTWNPTEPTSYYQLGSQSYINNAYLSFTPEPFGKLRLHTNAGQMVSSYGLLGKYGGGVYVNPLAATLRGIGETTTLEYDLSDQVTLSADHGFMMTRDGTPSDNIVPEASNGYRRLYNAGSFVNHAHLGLSVAGPYEITAELHFIDSFAHDERDQGTADNPQTPEINESYVKDPHIRIYTADVKVSHDTWGLLGLGLSYIDAKHSFPLTGLLTYGGDGSWLTDRWFGVTTGGSGKLLIAAANYGFSLGRILAYPTPFSGNGPDLVINTGVHWTKTWTDYQPYDGRVRWKGAIDGLYTFIRYVGVGARIDHILPNSYDSGETYNVLATRLQFKTDWQSRETVSLIYGKWFYGPRTRNEGTGLRTPDRLDDNLFALNFNLWW